MAAAPGLMMKALAWALDSNVWACLFILSSLVIGTVKKIHWLWLAVAGTALFLCRPFRRAPASPVLMALLEAILHEDTRVEIKEKDVYVVTPDGLRARVGDGHFWEGTHEQTHTLPAEERERWKAALELRREQIECACRAEEQRVFVEGRKAKKSSSRKVRVVT